MSVSASYSRSSSRLQDISPLLAEQAESQLPASSVHAASHSPSLSASVASSSPPPQPRTKSVGSVVVGLVSRAPPRQGPVGSDAAAVDEVDEDDSIAEDDSQANDADAAAAAFADAQNNASFSLPSHAASRTHCPLCSSAFDLAAHLPILLHAGHNVCGSCVNTSHGLSQVGSTVTCPVCKVVVAIPTDAGAREASLAHAIETARAAPLEEDEPPNAAATSGAAIGPLAAFPINFLLRDRLALHAHVARVDSGEVACAKCDDAASAVCTTCETFLCEFHQADHRRSKATKTHPLKGTSEYLAEDSPTSLSSRTMCPAHPSTEVELFCLECNLPICIRCSLPSGGTVHCTPSGVAHPTEDLRTASSRLLGDLGAARDSSRTKYTNIIRGMVSIQKVAQQIVAREQTVAEQVAAHFDAIHEAVEKRKGAVLAQLAELVSSKQYTLNVQNQILYIVARALEDATSEVDEMIASVGGATQSPSEEDAEVASSSTRSVSAPAKLLHVNTHLLSNLDALLKFQPVAMQPEEGEQFAFDANNNATNAAEGVDKKLLTTISRTGGLVDSLSIASLCTASGPGLSSAVVRTESRFQIQSRDRFNQARRRGGDPYVVEFIGPKGSASGRVIDHGDGRYSVRYMVLSPGQYSVIVSLRGRHIAGSPFRVAVHAVKEPPTSVGREWIATVSSRGSGQGQLLSPMGMGVGNDGSVYVADFGNNRISVFRQLSSGGGFGFVRTIGKSGTDNMSLKNPWAVAIDPLSQNVFVADSGNHRVQVFTAAGEWVRTWGSVGSAAGKFRHPAGIAIYTPTADASPASNATVGTATPSALESTSESVSSMPTTPRAISPELLPASAANGSFDSTAVTPVRPASPGVASAAAVAGGQLMFVSDREKHRIQVFDLSGRFLRMFGSNGSGQGQFLHPSGVAVDPRTRRLFVCDFSNHRVQVLTLTGQFIAMWGVRGTLPGQFTDPCGVTIDRQGLVYIADQGNHRVQVFTADGTFLRLVGQTDAAAGAGASSSKADKSQFTKPAAIAIVTTRADGSVLQLHDADAADSSSSEAAANTHTLVFVSDAAHHRLQVFN